MSLLDNKTDKVNIEAEIPTKIKRCKLRLTKLDLIILIAGKILKKLKLATIIFKAVMPLSHKTEIMTLSEAEKILNKTSPQPRGQVIIKRAESWNAEQKYDLQIIVPAYNAGQYIETCIDSVLEQKTSFKWQVIIINDGSTDNTSEILKKYSYAGQVCVLSQENKGFSGARNTGLDILSSKYVMFLDSDDMLEPGAIENMMQVAVKKSLDVLEGNFFNWIENKKIQASFSENCVTNNPIDDLRGFPWGKVVRTELFRNLQYPENYWYEDSIFSFLIYPQCHACGTIKDIVYAYRRNPNGISMSSKGSNKCVDTVYISKIMLESAKALNINYENCYNLLLRHILFSYTRVSFLNKNIRRAVFRVFCALIDEYYPHSATNDSNLRIIEKALRNCDFGIYELYGRLM